VSPLALWYAFSSRRAYGLPHIEPAYRARPAQPSSALLHGPPQRPRGPREGDRRSRGAQDGRDLASAALCPGVRSGSVDPALAL